MLLGEDAADETDDGPLVWENTDHVSPALDLLIESFLGVVAPYLTPVLLRNSEIRQHLILGGVEQLRKARPAWTEAVGDSASGGSSAVGVRLKEHGADRRRDHLLRAFRHQGQRIPHEMGSASLPTRTLEHGVRGLIIWP